MNEETLECANCYRVATIEYELDDDDVSNDIRFCPFCGWSESFGEFADKDISLLIEDE